MMDFEPIMEHEWAEVMMPTVASTTRASSTTAPPAVSTTTKSLQRPQEFWSFGSGPTEPGEAPNAPVEIGTGVPYIITSTVQGEVVKLQSPTGAMQVIALSSNAHQKEASSRPPSPTSVYLAGIASTAQAVAPSVLVPGNSHPIAGNEHPSSAGSMHQKILATASSADLHPVVVHAPVISTPRIAQPAIGFINQPSADTMHQMTLVNAASAAVPPAVAHAPVKPMPVHSFIAQPATRFRYPLSAEAMHQMMLANAAEAAAPPAVISPPVRPAQPAVSHHYHAHPSTSHGYHPSADIWHKMILEQAARAAKTVPPTVPPAPVVVPTKPKLSLFPAAAVKNKHPSPASRSFKPWSNHVPSTPKIDSNAKLLQRAVAARLKRLRSLISGQPLVLSELRVVPRQRKHQQTIQEPPVRAIHERPSIPHAYRLLPKQAPPTNTDTSRGFANAFISAHELIGAVVAARKIPTTPSYHSPF